MNCSPLKRLAALSILAAGAFLPAIPVVAQVTGPVVESPDTESPDKGAQEALTETETPDLAGPKNAGPQPAPAPVRFDLIAGDLEYRIDRLIDSMTLAEKVGQLVQIYPNDLELSDKLAARIRNGKIGSLFYPGNAAVIREAQQIAVEESRLGIPLLIARDVVHGFRTIAPIPLGQAATWNPELVEQSAMLAAKEARSEGIGWTFAPMVDICRDARWGRIAETLGEDPKLAGDLAAAMVRGFQMERNGKLHGMVACAKHYVGYGLSEGGRDYNRVSVSTTDLHNVLLPPFHASAQAGCRTFMTTFSEVNGLPGTAHKPLLEGVLKRDWRFQGFVVSDWASITEMVVHGYARDNEHAAELAILSGVDMDMCSPAFSGKLAKLVREGKVSHERLDDAVRRVIRCKIQLATPGAIDEQFGLLTKANREAAREIAQQSVVLLKNNGVLPLDQESLKRVAVIGPMADAPKQQLGCWALDGKAEDSVTPLTHLRERLAGQAEVIFARGAKNSFNDDDSQIAEAVAAASKADVAILFIGEDAVLSGEARCRSTLNLPGVQTELVKAVAKTGTPTVLVFLAGRPLTIEQEVQAADAALYAWHPGTMAGPALGDLLMGDANPSGKLPVTFPRSVGQTPIYYNHSNTGRPHPPEYEPLIGSDRPDLPKEFQYSSHYLDERPGPLFPFGYGLSYTSFEYSDIQVQPVLSPTGQSFVVSAGIKNVGERLGVEVVQLYVRDSVAGAVRPVRELKAYQRTRLEPGQTKRVSFTLSSDELGYFDAQGVPVTESGEFQAWIGGDSTTNLGVEFHLKAPPIEIAPMLHDHSPTAAGLGSPIR